MGWSEGDVKMRRVMQRQQKMLLADNPAITGRDHIRAFGIPDTKAWLWYISKAKKSNCPPIEKGRYGATEAIGSRLICADSEHARMAGSSSDSGLAHRSRMANTGSSIDNILKSRMCGPQVRFRERWRGVSPSAHSTIPEWGVIVLHAGIFESC